MNIKGSLTSLYAVNESGSSPLSGSGTLGRARAGNVPASSEELISRETGSYERSKHSVYHTRKLAMGTTDRK